jgi:hypothetical protein
MVEETSDSSDVDAEELWQLLNNYAHGGHLLEVGNYVVSEDNKKEFSDYLFWPTDKDGQHIGGWWPKTSEVNFLIQERLVEPQNWEDNSHSHTESRKYLLTATGEELASLGEEAVFAYFRKKNIHAHESGDTRWG